MRHQRFPEVEQTSSCRTLPKEEVKGRRQFWCLPPNIFSYQKLILSAKSKSAVHTCLDHPRRVQRFQSGAPKCQSSSRAKPVHPLHMRDDCLQIGSVPHLIPSGCHSWSISAFVSFFFTLVDIFANFANNLRDYTCFSTRKIARHKLPEKQRRHASSLWRIFVVVVYAGLAAAVYRP